MNRTDARTLAFLELLSEPKNCQRKEQIDAIYEKKTFKKASKPLSTVGTMGKIGRLGRVPILNLVVPPHPGQVSLNSRGASTRN